MTRRCAWESHDSGSGSGGGGAGQRQSRLGNAELAARVRVSIDVLHLLEWHRAGARPARDWWLKMGHAHLQAWGELQRIWQTSELLRWRSRACRSALRWSKEVGGTGLKQGGGHFEPAVVLPGSMAFTSSHSTTAPMCGFEIREEQWALR